MAQLVTIPYDASREAHRMSALATPNDLIAAVVGQTYVEFVLREMLCAQVANKRRFEALRLTFDITLSLVLSFSMVPHDSEQVVRKLAAIRNRFAHRIDHSLTVGEVNDAFASSSKSVQRNVRFLEKQPFSGISEHGWRLRLLYVTIQTLLVVTAAAGVNGVPEPAKPDKDFYKKFPDPRNVGPVAREGFIAGATWFTVETMRKQFDPDYKIVEREAL
jgi:hypothetical protein